MARLHFFQFLNSPMGSSLLNVITYNGWPSKEDWVKWEAWWDKEAQGLSDQMTRKGEKGLSAEWHFKAKRCADLIQTAVNEMTLVTSMNMLQWSVEKWMWNVSCMRNALITLNILPWPIPTEDNWFTRVNSAGKLNYYKPFKATF